LLQAEYRDFASEYAERVKAHFDDRLVSICFFGSAARGEASLESDIDVLVIAENLPRDYGLRIRETNRIHELLRKGEVYKRLRSTGASAFISDVYLTPEEAQSHPPILLDVADHGIVVYDREGFLARVLEDIRERLRQLGGRRIRARKGYYWVLKPDAKPTEVVEI
jgi:hypothetical protein